MTATAVASDLGDGTGYRKGRDYAASLGIVPKQHTTGGRPVLLGISKRGNRHLRTLLIHGVTFARKDGERKLRSFFSRHPFMQRSHGARAVVKNCKNKTDQLSRWLQALLVRRGFNKTALALANKNARILWAMAQTGKPYEAP